MKIKAFLALLALFCILFPALAQTKPQAPLQPQKTTNDQDDDIVRISTNLVQVDAVVTKDGKPVPNLTVDDFEIYEDGRRQVITSFAYISNVPTSTPQPSGSKSEKGAIVVPFTPLKRDDPHRTIAFVVDDLGTSAESMSHVRKQLRKIVAEKLQPNDLVAIIRTGGEVGALQQFTNDKRVLNRAVDQLKWNLCSRMGPTVLPPVTRESLVRSVRSDEYYRCGGQSIYDTMTSLRFVLDALGQLPGRKAMILLSDNLPIENQETKMQGNLAGFNRSRSYSGSLRKVAEMAIRSSVVIYSVDTQGLQYTGPTAADQFNPLDRNALHNIMSGRSHVLSQRREGGELIARQTGGFQIRNSNSFRLDRILEDQNGYYVLGYRPTDETFNRRFHQIKAKVKRSGMTLRTRYGFLGVSEEEAKRQPLSTRDLTNLALASPFAAQDIELDLTSFFTDKDRTGSVVRSFVYVDVKDLTFTTVNGRQQASIELHGVIYGDNGAVMELAKGGGTIKLSESEYQHAMRNGVGISFDMPVKRHGFYQVRVAVRDKNSSKMGSAGEFVTVPNLKDNKLAVSGIVLANVAQFSAPADAADQAVSNPGARRFQSNSNLYYAFRIYNAAIARGSQLREMVMEAKLFRDGKIVFSGPEVPIPANDQKDLTRVLANGVIRLTPDLGPGTYYLQVVVTDRTKSKAASAVQWVDFDIVK